MLQYSKNNQSAVTVDRFRNIKTLYIIIQNTRLPVNPFEIITQNVAQQF